MELHEKPLREILFINDEFIAMLVLEPQEMSSHTVSAFNFQFFKRVSWPSAMEFRAAKTLGHKNISVSI